VENWTAGGNAGLMRAVMMETVLARFMKQSPVTVLAQLALERTFTPDWIDELFEKNRKRQYSRDLLFSTTVELMSLVALGLQPSIHAAAQATDDIGVSLTALYKKINGTESNLNRALVAGSANRLSPIAKELRAQQTLSFPGYSVRVIDGNHLPASEKRLAALRGLRGAALPGHSLVVYDPDAQLVVDLVPSEDAHAQERTLVPAVIETVEPGQVWIADRNFSTSGIMTGIHDRGGAFIIREHGSSPNPTALGTAKKRGSSDTGEIYEQAVQIEFEPGKPIVLRRIEVHLTNPTQGGDKIIRILTNLPKSKSATTVASAYRQRWKIENMFQWLESVLHSEVRTLGHPKAALFAFSVATVAYNALSLIQSAIEQAHSIEPEGDQALSLYYVVNAIKITYEGMLISVPDEEWESYRSLSSTQVSRLLLDVAANVKIEKFRKHKRGVKKITKKGYAPGHVARSHVSTARLLQQAESSRKTR
jgi:IS4 transposase